MRRPNCLNNHPKHQDKTTMLHPWHRPMFRCQIRYLQKHRMKMQKNQNDDRENTSEPVPHSSISHLEWRPEYEVPPPEPGDSAVTRRRVVAKRPPTGDEEEETRQKRLRSEPVPELFSLTGEELSETSSKSCSICSRHLVQNIVKIPVSEATCGSVNA